MLRQQWQAYEYWSCLLRKNVRNCMGRRQWHQESWVPHLRLWTLPSSSMVGFCSLFQSCDQSKLTTIETLRMLLGSIYVSEIGSWELLCWEHFSRGMLERCLWYCSYHRFLAEVCGAFVNVVDRLWLWSLLKDPLPSLLHPLLAFRWSRTASCLLPRCDSSETGNAVKVLL